MDQSTPAYKRLSCMCMSFDYTILSLLSKPCYAVVKKKLCTEIVSINDMIETQANNGPIVKLGWIDFPGGVVHTAQGAVAKANKPCLISNRPPRQR